MALYFKNYRFAPKWYFALLTLLLCVLFVRLGYWQLHRAAEKEQLQASFSARLQQAPVSLAQMPKQGDILYYPLRVTGHYDNAHIILLDNKMHDHQVGYEVVTPFLPNGDLRVLLVNRGWVAAGNSRRVLPQIPLITGEQTVTGNAYQSPGKPFTLGNPLEANAAWPLRMQVLDVAVLEHQLQQPLYPFMLLLSANHPEGFVRDWQPVAMSADKSRGYAVQWFTFALVLIIIFIVLSIRKKG